MTLLHRICIDLPTSCSTEPYDKNSTIVLDIMLQDGLQVTLLHATVDITMQSGQLVITILLGIHTAKRPTSVNNTARHHNAQRPTKNNTVNIHAAEWPSSNNPAFITLQGGLQAPILKPLLKTLHCLQITILITLHC